MSDPYREQQGWQPVTGEPYAPVEQPAQGPWGQYPQAPYPQAQYGPPNAYGYAPAPPAWSAYGPDPRLAGRPTAVLTAAVLGYVCAGLLIVAGGLLLFGSAIVTDLENAFHNGTGYGGELAFDGVVNFIAGGLLITGAVMITGRNPNGRFALSAGAGIVLAEAIYWLVRFDFLGNGRTVYAVLFIGLAGTALAALWSPTSRAWLGRSRPAV